MNFRIIFPATALASLLFSQCTLLAPLGIEDPAQVEAQEFNDLLLATAAYVATQEDDGRDLNCSVTSTAGSTTTTVTETLKIPSATETNMIFTGDDIRATSAVYFVFDSVEAGETWSINNFGFWTTGNGEGTVAPFDSTWCPLDTTGSETERSSTTTGNASVSYSINNNAGTTTLTFNEAGIGYIVQFYTGSGTNTNNGADATLTKN
jgi:hypothetical protein